jgi:hypothetical protein
VAERDSPRGYQPSPLTHSPPPVIMSAPSADDLQTLMHLDIRRGNLASAKERLTLLLGTRVQEQGKPRI